MYSTYYHDVVLDALRDEMLMMKVKRVIDSIDTPEQLLSLRKYCELAKKKMRIKRISNHYINIYYAEARDRVMPTNNGTRLWHNATYNH